jgi:Type IV secretion-system coupling protein DNA-binding domain
MGLLNRFNRLLGGVSAVREHVTLGGVPLPFSHEPLHLLVAGATGTGKTVLTDEVLDTLVARGDRFIVADANGHYLRHHFRAGDKVLNPFDTRSPGWSVFNEARHDFDYDRLARSLVPDGHGNDAAWHHYGQVLVSETLRVLKLRGEADTGSLLHWLTVAPTDALMQLLAGTPAAGLFDKDAGRAMASTRFIVTSHLNPHKHLPAGDFSLRTWLSQDTGNLFLTWRSDMLTSLKPLVSCWTGILLSAILSLPPDPDRRIWLVLDELAALGQLSSLELALTNGRKHGLCVLAGVQSVAQLDRVYGRDSAIVLRSCFRNLVVLGIAKTDPDTSEAMSISLGEREVDREQASRSEGMQGVTKSVSVQRVRERLVLPSELNQLPDLTGYLALAGDEPTRKITLIPRRRPVMMAAIDEVPSC